VLSRNVEVGQTVSAGLQAPTLFVIARDLTKLELQARVDEGDIGGVAAGHAVTFTVDAYPRQTFTGIVRLVRLQPQTVQNVVTYTTVIDVPNDDGRLKPGMTSTVSIEVARATNALRAPAAALRFRPSDEVLKEFSGVKSADDTGGEDRRRSSTVWQLVDGHIREVPIKAGVSDGTMVAVESGLTEGAPIVVGVVSKGEASTTTSATSGSPLLPQMPRRPAGNGNAPPRGTR
jgi:HlyD family secretion protein